MPYLGMMVQLFVMMKLSLMLISTIIDAYVHHLWQTVLALFILVVDCLLNDADRELVGLSDFVLHLAYV
jgi:hypothetical protein